MSYPYQGGNREGHAYPNNSVPAQPQLYQNQGSLQVNYQPHLSNAMPQQPIYGQQQAVSIPQTSYSSPLYYNAGQQAYHQAPSPDVRYQQPFSPSGYASRQSSIEVPLANDYQQSNLVSRQAFVQSYGSQPQVHPPRLSHAQFAAQDPSFADPRSLSHSSVLGTPQHPGNSSPQVSGLTSSAPFAMAPGQQYHRPRSPPASPPRQPIQNLTTTAQSFTVQQPGSQSHPGHSHPGAAAFDSGQEPAALPSGHQQRASSFQRRVLDVQIPANQRSPSSYSSGMAPPAKRRKSNDSETIVVSHARSPAQRQQNVQQSNGAPATPAQPAASRSVSRPAVPSSTPDLDYQATLLALSDEFISAAYNLSAPLAEGTSSDAQLDEYYSYLASGMGCLESVLNNYRIPDARKEARIRLRLACLMCEETENDMDAEAILSKGIALCDRARLVDLRYAMNHLLARIWFKGGQSRAAMKAVEKLIDEVEKLQLTHWAYAFRFLRVSFSMQEEINSAETANAVKHLLSIAKKSGEAGDHAVYTVASAMEALVHVRARGPECIDSAQSALAAARTHQFTEDFQSMPQARVLLDCVDLACNLIRLNAEQATANLTSLHDNLDAYYKASSVSKSGRWLLPFLYKATAAQDISADTGGIFASTSDGKIGLSLTWLTRTQATSLGFLLSGLTNLQKNNAESGGKTGAYLQEGLKMNGGAPEKTLRSLSAASNHTAWQRQMRVLLQSYAVFTCCANSEWEKAMGYIRNIRAKIAEYPNDKSDETTKALVCYLEATCKHGLGDLEGAVRLYRSPTLALPTNIDTRAFAARSSSSFKILAALNSITALRKIGSAEEANDLLSRVEPMCVVQKNSNGNEYGNKAMASAFCVLKATSAGMSIIKTKQFIQLAIQAAQATKNDRLLTIVMNHMAQLFFATIVGEQASACCNVARKLALKSGDSLWTAVADGMSSDALIRTGKMDEAAEMRREGHEAMSRLPASLKDALFESERKDT